MKKTTVSLLAFVIFLCAAHAECVVLEEELAPVISSVEAVSNVLGGAISGHIADTNNPHSVTAAQLSRRCLTSLTAS